MMRLAKAAAAAVVLVLGPGEAGAVVKYGNTHTAEVMAGWCRSHLKAHGDGTMTAADPKEAFDAGLCRGSFYAIGYATMGFFPPWRVCVPGEVTLVQAIRIFLRYTDEHPERLHEEWFHVARAALKEAFPCEPTPTGER